MTGMPIEVNDLISSDDTVSLDSTVDDEQEQPQHMETDEEDAVFPIGVNCPEKIVLLLDVSNEMKRKSFGFNDEQNITNMDLLKKSLAMFVKTKSMLNTKHQFSLAIVQDNMTYMLQEWSQDSKVILSAIKELAASESNEENKEKTSDKFIANIYWMSQRTLARKTLVALERLIPCYYPALSCYAVRIFNYIKALTSILEFINDKIAWKRRQKRTSFPENVLRIIFICARNQLEMTQEAFEIWKNLHQSDCFFFDTLLIRDTGIIEIDEKVLRDANIRNENYNLQVSRHRGEFFNKMAVLLKHPLQRTPLL